MKQDIRRQRAEFRSMQKQQEKRKKFEENIMRKNQSMERH